MIKCPNCESTNIKILDSYPDGDDSIDTEIKCNQCREVHWTTISEEEANEYLEELDND